MAKRDQIAGAFGRLDAGQTRDRQHIAFGHRQGADGPQHPGRHHHARTGHCQPGNHGLMAHIDHVRSPAAVEMGEGAVATGHGEVLKHELG